MMLKELQIQLLGVFIIFVSIQEANTAGVCYKSVSYHEKQYYSTKTKTHYGKAYKCGFLGWVTCRKTVSKTHYKRSSRDVVKYKHESFCCSGYYGRPNSCKRRPYVTRHPVDIVVETTNNVRFYAQAGGHGPFSYQWYHNGHKMSGKTSHTLYINNIKMGNRGSYYCKFCNRDNYCISSRSAQLTVTVNPPVIIRHPMSQTILLRTNNHNMSLSCEARGRNLKYVWERLNVAIPNNTQGIYTSTLKFTFLSPDNAGKYRCKAFNSSGYGYSNYAVLNIYAPSPQIIQQPTNTTAADPFGVHFTCIANGYGKIEINWKNEIADKGIPSKAIITEEHSLESLTSTLFIPNVVLADEGGYYCSVHIGPVSTLSQIAYLQQILTPMIQVKMDSNTVNLLVRNYNVTMRCLPSDTVLNYQWNRKNASLPASAVGMNTSTLTIYRLTPEDAGDYQCVLSNISGEIASEFETLKINVPPPEISVPPQNITASAYTTITFSCTGRGFGDVKVIWTKPPSKVTSTAIYTSDRYDDHITSTITLTHLVDIYAGRYCCAIENHVGSSELGCAYLHIEVPCPEISLSPINNTIIVEEDTTFICKAFSFGTIQYKWERMNSSIPDKAVITDTCSSTLSIPNSTQFDEGSYCCIATNKCGPVKECAILSVIAIPIITLQPKGTTVQVGAAGVEMNCSAIGHSTISYQWEKYNSNENNWQTIPKNQQIDIDNVSTYRINMLTKNDNGKYHCVALNIDGSGYSESAMITVYAPPSITLSSTNIDAIEGHEITLTCTANNDVNSPYDAQITWFGPTGRVIESDEHVTITNIKLKDVMTSALKFHPINHTQTGINKCKATNHPNSSNEMKFTITVEYAPIIHITPSKSPYVTEVGPRFLLLCSAEGRPPPSVQWYKNGEPFSEVTPHSVQQIHASRSSSSDSALYECKGTNIIGNKTQERKSAIEFQVIDPREGPCGTNNGGCDQICTAPSGIVRCFCKVGYFSIAFLPSKCFDVDECLLKLDKCDGTCINTAGSYKCTCPYGQVLASNSYSCIKCSEEKLSEFMQITPVIANNITEAMWHVMVCKDNSTICSGSLINDRFIVTTANCLCNDKSTAAESILIKMNKTYGCSVDEPNEIEYTVTQITCHPMYNAATSAYNIVLLKLAVTLNTNLIEPVCLPTAKDISLYAVNEFTGIYGYGHLNMISLADDTEMSGSDDDSEISSSADGNNVSAISVNNDNDELLFQVTQIVSNNECNAAYNYSVSITNQIVCTTSGINENCWESNGAPLVVQRNNHIILVGMVSYNEVYECYGGSHVMHTKLDGFQDWIASQAYSIKP